MKGQIKVIGRLSYVGFIQQDPLKGSFVGIFLKDPETKVRQGSSKNPLRPQKNLKPRGIFWVHVKRSFTGIPKDRFGMKSQSWMNEWTLLLFCKWWATLAVDGWSRSCDACDGCDAGDAWDADPAAAAARNTDCMWACSANSEGSLPVSDPAPSAPLPPDYTISHQIHPIWLLPRSNHPQTDPSKIPPRSTILLKKSCGIIRFKFTVAAAAVVIVVVVAVVVVGCLGRVRGRRWLSWRRWRHRRSTGRRSRCPGSGRWCPSRKRRGYPVARIERRQKST